MSRGSFFDGFNQGYDATGRVMQDIDLGKIAREKPETTTTAADPAQQYDGPDGGLAAPGGYQPGPKTTTKFLGTTVDGEMTQAQQDRARYGAMATSIGKNDPVRGLQMRRELASQDREDSRFAQESKRFGWEEAAQPGKQRLADAQLRGAERTDRVGQLDEDTNTAFGQRMEEYTGSPEQLEESIKYVHANSNSLRIGMPGKDGFIDVSITKPDGHALFLKLPKQDQATVFAASKIMHMNPARALALMAGVNKELAAAVAAENGLTDHLVKNANDVAGKRGELSLSRERNSIGREGLRIQSARLERDNMGVAQYFTDDKGNTYASVPTMTKQGMEMKVVRVNNDAVKGLKPLNGRQDQGLKVNPDGSVTQGGKLYEKDAKGVYKEAQGLGPSATDLAFAEIMKSRGQKPGPSISESSGNLAPIGISHDVTKYQTPADTGNPDDYERRAKRGFLGGIQYEYYNPKTGDRLSLDEFQRQYGN
jgi:hypothetical protein